MECNDCFMSEVCDIRIQRDYEVRVRMGLPNAHCPYYKDKSRIIELPCKVGDTVYVIKKGYDKILDGYVKRTSINKDGQLIICIAYPTEWFYTTGNFKNSSFGKTVFLTKEAAVQALMENRRTDNE